MVHTRTRKRARSRRPEVVQKPRGTFHPRVQKVGPEHFGIVAIDCAKEKGLKLPMLVSWPIVAPRLMNTCSSMAAPG